MLDRLDSYAQLDEILAYDKILNALQEERLNRPGKSTTKK